MMRRVIFILLLPIYLIMGLLTFLVLDSENSVHLFSSGSIASVMKLFKPRFWVVLTTYILFILSTIIFRKNIKHGSIVTLILLCIWFLSGRTIGILYTGEVFVGWFYINTGRIRLYEENGKCQENVMKITNVELSNFLYIKFINECIEENVFANHFLGQDVKNYFENNRAKEALSSP